MLDNTVVGSCLIIQKHMYASKTYVYWAKKPNIPVKEVRKERKKLYLTPQTLGKVQFSSLNCKTRYRFSSDYLKWLFFLPVWF